MEETNKRVKKQEEFNPLKKVIVEVKYLRSKSEMFNGKPDSPLDGGLADDANITLAVPYKNGVLMSVLTPDEQRFFENRFGLREGDMNAIKIENNYWTTYNKGYINRVTLDKITRRLDLSNPKDYIEWKILLANDEIVCESQRMFEDKPLDTYRFILHNENTVSEMAGRSADIKVENFQLFAKYMDDADMLRVILYLLERKKTSPVTKIELLKEKVSQYLVSRAKDCNEILNSKNLEQKKVILIGVEKNVVSDRNGFYFVTETGQRLSDDYTEPSLNNAADFLANPVNQELYFSLSNKIK